MKIDSASGVGRLSKEFAEKCEMRPWVLNNVLNPHRSHTAEQLVTMHSMIDDNVYNAEDEFKRMRLTGK